MKVRRKKADIAFSMMIRNRDKWTCQNCGVNKSDDPGTYDCAHIMGRRSVGLRWHPDNAIGLCRACHIFFTSHPFDWRDFCVERFGEDRVSELRLVSNQTVKWSPKVREDIYRHLREQLEFGKCEPHELMHVFD